MILLFISIQYLTLSFFLLLCLFFFDFYTHFVFSFSLRSITGYAANKSGLSDIKARFEQNLISSGSRDKVEVFQGDSKLILRTGVFSISRFDYYSIIYVDGSHWSKDVLQDTVLAWGLLRVGGVMIFDDYQMGYTRLNGVMAEELTWSIDAALHPKKPRSGIDAFVHVMQLDLVVVHAVS